MFADLHRDLSTPRIIFHVGGPKTGSSAIQSFMARNREALSSMGFDYVSHPSFDRAKEFRISSGNGGLIQDQSYRNFKVGQIYSSEALFDNVDLDLLLSRIASSAQSVRPSDIVIVLYCRDPLDWAISAYSQLLKRHGLTLTLDEFLNGHVVENHLDRLIWWIESSKKVGVTLKFYNYSVHKDRIIDHFVESALDVTDSKGLDFTNSNRRVNRSLNAVETELFRILNTEAGGSPRFSSLSDHLVETVNVKQEAPLSPRLETYEVFIQKIGVRIQNLNRHLEGNEQLRVPSHPPIFQTQNNDVFEVSIRWISSLASGFARNAVLSHDEVNTLRDLALRIELGDNLSIQDALSLMRIAQSSRPDGPLIGKKISQWEALESHTQITSRARP